jgi:WD40 repeat protein
MQNTKGHTGGVRDVKLSGTRLVSASEDHSVVVWDVVRATAVRRYAAAHRGVAYSCAFVDADANLVASGGDDGVVRLWDLRVASSTMASESSNVSNNGSSDGSVAQLRRHTAGVQRVRIASGNAMELASAGKDCRAIRWDLRRLAAVQDFVGHRNTIFGMSVVRRHLCRRSIYYLGASQI